jgi:predicted HTH domain antitoxin
VNLYSKIIKSRSRKLNSFRNKLNNQDLSMLIASQLYEQGKLSLGQAAEVAGLTKRTFAELLGSYAVSIFNFPTQDL